MKLLLVGMEGELATLLSTGVANLVEETVIETDWTSLEDAVESLKPDVVAIHLGSRPGQTLALVRKVRALYPAVAYVALAESDNPDLVNAVAEAGCTDLVLVQECPKDLRRALRVVKTRDVGAGAEGEAIVVMGAKGGVGTTLVAINIAAELALRTNKRTVLVDLHLYMGDMSVSLDLRPHPSTLWFLQQGSMIDARTWAESPPLHRAGFRMLGLAGELAEADSVTAEQVVYLIDRLRTRYEHVIIDTGSEVSEVSLTAAATAEQRFIVLNDDLACRTGARRRLAALRSVDVSAKLILNRIDTERRKDLKMLEEFVGAPVQASLANDWTTCQTALEQGQVIRQLAPRSQLSQDLGGLGDFLSGEERAQEKRKRTFFDFFR